MVLAYLLLKPRAKLLLRDWIELYLNYPLVLVLFIARGSIWEIFGNPERWDGWGVTIIETSNSRLLILLTSSSPPLKIELSIKGCSCCYVGESGCLSWGLPYRKFSQLFWLCSSIFEICPFVMSCLLRMMDCFCCSLSTVLAAPAVGLIILCPPITISLAVLPDSGAAKAEFCLFAFK